MSAAPNTPEPSAPEPSARDTSLESGAASATQRRHPPALYVLFATEAWERFSYYGMRALLMLYLTKAVIEGGVGFDQKTAGTIYGTYTGLVYLTPLVGGWLADNVLGQRKAITIGGILMALGQFCLFRSSASAIHLLYLGLLLLILGNGMFKPNISTMVGALYPLGDKRRDAAFTIFYMGINLGAFCAPLLCGYLAENAFAQREGDRIIRYGYQYGFLAAGVGMTLGQLVFNTIGPRLLGDVGKRAQRVADNGAGGAASIERAEHAERKRLTPEEKDRIKVIFLLAAFVMFFWAGFEQAGSSLTLYTDKFIDRRVGSFTVPTSWFQSVNAGFIVLLAPVFAALWARLARAGKEPNTPLKMAIGLLLLGGGFLLMVGAVMQRGGDLPDEKLKASLLWLVGTYLIHTTGELCLSPVGLSMVTKLAPLRLASLLMGVWFLANACANYIAGFVGGYVEAWGALVLFGGTAGFVMVLGLLLLALNKPILRLMHGRG